jgi:hypothetical protein
LLTRGPRRGFVRGLSGGESLRENRTHPVCPTAIVFDDLIDDIRHCQRSSASSQSPINITIRPHWAKLGASAGVGFIVDFYDIISLIFHYHYQWNKVDERVRNRAAILEGTVKANKYRGFLASNPAERVGNS